MDLVDSRTLLFLHPLEPTQSSSRPYSLACLPLLIRSSGPFSRATRTLTENNGGNTALHMAREYDYYYTCQVLVEAGADGTIVNGNGSVANLGIEGKVDVASFLPAVTDAANVDELKVALQGLIDQGEAVDRGEKGKAIMGLRKRGLRGDAEVEALVKQAM